MGKSTVTCSECGHNFTPGKTSETILGLGGAGAAGYAGGSAGLAMLGTAMVATLPFALAGAAAGVAVGSQLTMCPKCDKIQRK